MWLERLFSLKYTALVIATMLLITGLAGLAMGVLDVFHSLMILVGIEEGRVGIHVIEAVDKLLFALVLFILAAGIFKLFVGNKDTFSNTLVLKSINSFKELKVLLWETLLLTLTVWASLGFFVDTDRVKPEQMILPGSILLLALALYLVKGGKKD